MLMQLLEKSHEEKDKLREEAKAEKMQLEQKLEEQMAAAKAEMESNMERMREDLYEELTPDEPEPLVHDDELIRLQLRLVGLYEMELISEEEHCVLENLCADFAELQSTVPGAVVTKDRASLTRKPLLSLCHCSDDWSAAVCAGADVLLHPIAGTLQKLVGLAEFAKSDETLARQLRRKFLAQ